MDASQLLAVLERLSPAQKAEIDRLLLAPGPIDCLSVPLIDGHPSHAAQIELWNADEKIIALVAGAQSGKSCYGPRITLREIFRKWENGKPNDHLVASPTYKLMNKKLLPEYKRFFISILNIATWNAGDFCLELTDEGIFRLTGERPLPGTTVTIFFGHAQTPESLESATYKSAVLDEAGQDQFRTGSYAAILRRVVINRGRIYILTTPYNRNWFYEQVYRRARVVQYIDQPDGTFKRVELQQNGDPNIRVITCPSIMNPAFGLEEWEFMKTQHPDWVFDMMYRGMFSIPLGAVFDSFTDDCIVEPFEIPEHWPVFAGLDFGLVNSAAVVVAEEWKQGEPTGTYYMFNSYRSPSQEGTSTRDNVKAIHKLCKWKKPIPYGGAHAESIQREAYASAGLPVFEPPFSGLWNQINTLWVAFHHKKLKIFSDQQAVIDDLRSISREIGDDDEPIPDKIKDEQKYHYVAAMRYLGARLFRKIHRGLKRNAPTDRDDGYVPIHALLADQTADQDGVPAGGGRSADVSCAFFQGPSPLI